jgi:D-alanyl-D-alanine carboxypeptidase/D-alanyl-D-alanine-endopeptidase (penicillin-binding protein 4)
LTRSTRLLLFLGLGFLGAGAGLVAYGILNGDEVPEAPRDEAQHAELATDLLSARRIPEWTTELVPAHRMAADLGPVIARTTPETCVQVGYEGVDLFNHQGSTQLIPASNMKVLTSAAALALLGPDTTLNTPVLADTAPVGGMIQGNLYMVGGGDPMLTSEGYQLNRTKYRHPETDLEAFADQIVAGGVRAISGSVVGDRSLYGDQLWVDSWPQRQLSSGEVAQLSSLLVNDGWLVDPTTGEGPGGPAPDPAAHAASVLTQLLVERGVLIAGPPASGVAAPAAVEVATVESAPVRELVADVLSFSDNTTADLLVKQIGLKTSGQPTTEAGISAIKAWATENGHPVGEATLLDGSGLSYDNRISCGLLASVLRADGPAGQVAEALAVPGEPGTLSDFGGGELATRLRAKTGTLASVTSLSGWLRSNKDADLDFEILMNTPGRATTREDQLLQQQILAVMLEHPKLPSLVDAGPLETGS